LNNKDPVVVVPVRVTADALTVVATDAATLFDAKTLGVFVNAAG
jgi:hypothetical protein